jgi:hypothetical protein
VESFPGIFDNINYVTTFKALHLKYEQNMESEKEFKGANSAENGAKDAELRKSRACDDEEAYFDGDDGEEDSNSNGGITLTTTLPSIPNKPLSPLLHGADGGVIDVGIRPPTPPIELSLSPKHHPVSLRDVAHDHDMLPTVMPGTAHEIKPISPNFKSRPISPPVKGKESKDSLNKMFDLKNRGVY